MHRSTLPVVVLLLSLGCSGRSADPELRSAWSEYYSTLVDVRNRLQESRYFDTPVAQAEAYRYLTGLVSLHNRMHIHFGDPMHPVFFRWVGLDSNWGFSNPDSLYLSANISGDGAYRITGRLGTASETTIGSHGGDGQNARAGARIHGKDLVLGRSGEFELVLSATPEPGNWLRLDPGARRVTVSQIFEDWDRETKGAFRIERIGLEGRAPAPLDPNAVARQLTNAARAVRRYALAWLEVADGLSFLPANTLAPPELPNVSPAAWFISGHYALEADQALIVAVPAPEASSYWGWSLHNAWSEALDYTNRQTSLNSSQASIDSDGMLRLVLAAEDPGVPNWLDTSGHPRGFITWRVTAESEPARAQTRLLSVSGVRSALPSGTPHLGADERRALLHRRQQHIARRYAD